MAFAKMNKYIIHLSVTFVNYNFDSFLFFFWTLEKPACRKTDGSKGFGGKDSVKGNRQGFLSPIAINFLEHF